MNLTISNYNNVYKVKGNLVKLNIPNFLNELKDVLNQTDDVILNLQELSSIDNHGVSAIAKIHNEALTQNKKLAIVGFGDKTLINTLQNTKVA